MPGPETAAVAAARQLDLSARHFRTQFGKSRAPIPWLARQEKAAAILRVAVVCTDAAETHLLTLT